MSSQEIDERFKRDLETGERSLFFSACSLSNDVRDFLREELTTHPELLRMHLRFALFLFDFFENSDGGDFWSSWERTHNGKREKFGEDYRRIYQRRDFRANTLVEMPDNDKSRCQRIKSKCWILDSADSSEGRTSEVWRCLRDAIHSYQTNDGDISVSGRKNDERAFMALLRSAPDSVEWREYCRLVEILARQERPGEEPWRTLAEKCRSILGSYAYVDWYLRLEGDDAQYGIGFDWFPSGGLEADWRKFDVDGEEESIKSPTEWFHWVPWNRPVKVRYAGNSWDTLNASDESCFFSSARHSYGVFVRYRAGNGSRGNWWTKDAEPQLSSQQREFLVCARTRDAMQRLKLVAVAEGVRIEVKKEGTLSATSPDSLEKTRFPYRIYSIAERPEDADVPVVLREEGAESPEVSIVVNGKTATSHVGGTNSLGIQLMDSSRNIVTFPSETLSLRVECGRHDREYEWSILVDGTMVGKVVGTDAKFPMDGVDDEGRIRNLEIRCAEKTSDGRTHWLPRKGGILLPNTVRGSLEQETQLPANWTRTASRASPIADRLEGFKKWTIEDPVHRRETVGKPDADPAWWFERGIDAWDESSELYRLDTPRVREFQNMDEARNWALCMPSEEGDSRPEGWDVTKAGYWRCPLSRLPGMGNADSFRYDPDADLDEFRNKDGTILFRYRYSPDKPTLCLCKAGTLGLFVPEGVKTQFDICAFSDKTKDLLVFGKRLARTQSDSRFTGIQNEWDGFCHETEGWDAVLVAFPASDDHHSLFEGEVSSCRLREGQRAPYDEGHLAWVPLVKAVCKNLPETHPARKLWIFQTKQRVTDECLRGNWETSIEELSRQRFSKGIWQNLLEEWNASGFHPLLEGLSEILSGRAKRHLISSHSSPPFDWIDGTKNGWIPFVEKWIECKKLSPETNCPQAFRDGAKQLLGEQKSLTEKRVKELLSYLYDVKNEAETFEKSVFSECSIPSILPRSWNPNVLRGKGRNEWATALCHAGEISNDVGSGETTLNGFSQTNETPTDLLAATEGDCAGKEPLVSILKWMSEDDHRKCQGKSLDYPTDREWAFCLAAMIVLGSHGCRATPELRELSVRMIPVFQSDSTNDPKAKGNKWTLLGKYVSVCREILKLPQLNTN